jgi:hypothetical protein
MAVDVLDYIELADSIEELRELMRALDILGDAPGGLVWKHTSDSRPRPAHYRQKPGKRTSIGYPKTAV